MTTWATTMPVKMEMAIPEPETAALCIFFIHTSPDLGLDEIFAAGRQQSIPLCFRFPAGRTQQFKSLCHGGNTVTENHRKILLPAVDIITAHLQMEAGRYVATFQ